MSWKNMSAFFNSRVLIALLMTCLCILPLAAQSQAPVQTIPGRLTLAEAENLLLQRNLTILASRYQIEVSRVARLIASYKPNPVLTVGAEQFPFYSPLADSYPRFFSTNSDAGAQPSMSPAAFMV